MFASVAISTPSFPAFKLEGFRLYLVNKKGFRMMVDGEILNLTVSFCVLVNYAVKFYFFAILIE